jgi:hypothetical protein
MNHHLIITYINFIYLVLFKVTSQLDTVYNNKTIHSIECLIHNEQYAFEYLESFPKSDTTQLNTYPLNLIKNFNQIKWVLIRDDDDHRSINSFYLKSWTRDEFLCATTTIEYAWKKRRRLIKLIKMTRDNHFACKWNLNKVNMNKNDNKYTIWSDYFNEPMYASVFVKIFDIHTRFVFLWSKKPNSKQFNWFIDCNKGIFLTS